VLLIHHLTVVYSPRPGLEVGGLRGAFPGGAANVFMIHHLPVVKFEWLAPTQLSSA
jgi:hypothetical protein